MKWWSPVLWSVCFQLSSVPYLLPMEISKIFQTASITSVFPYSFPGCHTLRHRYRLQDYTDIAGMTQKRTIRLFGMYHLPQSEIPSRSTVSSDIIPLQARSVSDRSDRPVCPDVYPFFWCVPSQKKSTPIYVTTICKFTDSPTSFCYILLPSPVKLFLILRLNYN